MSSVANNRTDLLRNIAKMPIHSPNKKRPRKSLNVYLGVDGGGTKTQAVLFDEDGNVLGEGYAGASNPLRVGVETAVAAIFQSTDAACDAANKSRSDVVSAIFALSICGL